MAYFLDFMPDSGSAYLFSYNSHDWQRIAPIVNALKSMGYPLWYVYGLEAGTAKWKAQISASMDRSYAVIVFITKGMFEKERCYVLNEYDQATGIRKTVIPVFLDSISLESVPIQYRAYVAEWKRMQGVPYRPETPDQPPADVPAPAAQKKNKKGQCFLPLC